MDEKKLAEKAFEKTLSENFLNLMKTLKLLTEDIQLPQSH